MKITLLLVAVIAALAVGGGFWWQSYEVPPPGWQGYVDADYVRAARPPPRSPRRRTG